MMSGVVKAECVFAVAAPPTMCHAETDVALKAKFFIVVFAGAHAAVS